MRADTRTISINAPPVKVAAYLSNVINLPRWAVGFAKAVRQSEAGWLVETSNGEMSIRIESDARTGTVDFWMTPVPGRDMLAASRVISRGEGSEYVFTQFQGPGMPDDVFAKNVQALMHELTVLKALMEVECPL